MKLSFNPSASAFVPGGAKKEEEKKDQPAPSQPEPVAESKPAPVAEAPKEEVKVEEKKTEQETPAPKKEKKKEKEVKPELSAEEKELQEELKRVEEEDRKAALAAANLAEAAAAGKPHVNVVFIGHVDHGKSTLSGAILLACGMVDKRDVQKLQSDAESEGRESWWKAFLMDTNPEERSKGKTQETARSHFETKDKMYTILDAPGHKAFVPSMISGAAQADVAVLVVSARTGEFEDGFVKGGQTKEHTTLVRTMGVSHILVAVNKMDDKTVEWSKQRFEDLQRQLETFLRKAGFKKDQISFVPMSGLNGLNLEAKIDPKICDWYKGDCLLGTLDRVANPRDQSGTQPVRFPVLDRYKDSGKVYVIGRVDGGKVTVGDTLVTVPGEHQSTVAGIESEFGPLKVARPGDNVTLQMKGMDENYVNSGSVLCSKGERLCPTTTRFQAQILISNLPESRPILTKGYQCVMHLHTCTTEVSIEKIVSVLDKKTGKPIKGQAFARKGSAVVVNITTSLPVAVERFEDYNALSRILLRDEDLTIAVGKVIKLAKAGHEKK